MEITFLHLGEFTLAMEHYGKALSLYDPELHHHDSFRYTQNPGVATRCFAAWGFWFLGQPDKARERIEEALAVAHELSEPHGLAHALLFAAIHHQFRREAPMAQECAEASLAVSTEHHLVMYEAQARITRGWALIEQGRAEEAIEEIQSALEAYQDTGTQLLRPQFLAFLAEALGAARQYEEGLRILEEAIALALRSWDRSYVAELYRIKGEFLLAQETGRNVAEA